MSSVLRFARFNLRRAACQIRLLSTTPPEVASAAPSTIRSDNPNSTRYVFRGLVSRVAAMDTVEKERRMNEAWNNILNHCPIDLMTMNEYLQARLDCDLPIDCEAALQQMAEKGIAPNERTFGVLISKACNQGDMEQTRALLRHLKASQLDITPFMFSSILRGYVKAGCPEELEATKDIMSKFGLWPSRSGYYGLLCGYASTGDLPSFRSTLKDFSTLYSEIPQLGTLFSHISLVKLYVLLMKNVPDSEQTCREVLSLFPNTLDLFAMHAARDGVLSLVESGRPKAALQLFKKADPHSCTDAYLLGLARCMRRKPEHAHLLSSFFEVTGISVPRLNLLLRRVDAPRADLSSLRLPETDIDGLFNCASKVDQAIVARDIVPRLLSLGVAPSEIVEKIKPRSLASVAAMACVFHVLSPPDNPLPIELKLDEALTLSEKFSQQGLLPCADYVPMFLTRRSCLRSNLLATSQALNRPVADCIDAVLTICGRCLGPESLKPFVARLVGQMYELTLGRRASLDDVNAALLQALVKKCLNENIQFQENSWVLYALERLKIPEESLRRLQNPNTMPRRIDSMLDMLTESDRKEAIKA